MTDAEGRNTWRTDRYSPCPRGDAGTYLAFLASLGYEMSDIERAIADGARWTGDNPQGSALLADNSTASSGENPDSDTGPDAGTTAPSASDIGTGSDDGDAVVQTAA